MKCLKIKLTQTTACYRKHETIENQMTYPLPEPSTIIGAIREACQWRENRILKMSIQGNYETKKDQFFLTKVFYDNVMTDRGSFCLMPASDKIENNGFILIATVKNGKEVEKKDLKTGEGFLVYRPDLLKDYWDLKLESKNLNAKLKELKSEKSITLKSISGKIEKAKMREEFDEKIRDLESRKQIIANQIEHYRSFEKTPRKREMLYNVHLTLHILASPKNMQQILDNIYCLKSIGRSDDLVDIMEAEIVEYELAKQGDRLIDKSYLPTKVTPFFSHADGGDIKGGTVFYINKTYEIIDSKRIFEKERCLWAGDLIVKQENDEIFADQEGAFAFIEI